MIEVTVTCAWCQMKVTTNLEAPIPEGWHKAKVSGPAYQMDTEDTFCTPEHEREYTSAAPAAVAASVGAYKTTFLARMNDARTKWTERPMPAAQ
jgi:hypothetical protein